MCSSARPTRGYGRFSRWNTNRMMPFDHSTPTASRAIVDVSWFDLGVAFGLILIAVGIARWHGVGLAQRLVVGAVRAVAQLVLVGYVLVSLFALDRWYLVVVALLLMLLVATQAAVTRQPGARRRLVMITGVALLVASGVTLLYISTLVVRVAPWYNPQYGVFCPKRRKGIFQKAYDKIPW